MAKKNSNRKRRSRPLTIKQQTYFKLLCKGVPATQAALKAGYAGKNPAKSAYQATKSIRERIQHALFEAGLTPEGLVHKYLLPALNAEETEFAKFEGKITDSRDVIAWGPRIQAIRFAAELGGYLAPHEVTGKDGESLLSFPKVIDVTGMRSKPASQSTKGWFSSLPVDCFYGQGGPPCHLTSTPAVRALRRSAAKLWRFAESGIAVSVPREVYQF